MQPIRLGTQTDNTFDPARDWLMQTKTPQASILATLLEFTYTRHPAGRILTSVSWSAGDNCAVK